MANMLNFMEEFGNVPFKHIPFGAVDNLIYAQLSYCRFEGAAEAMPARMDELAGRVRGGVIAQDETLLRLAQTQERYRSTIAYHYKTIFDEVVATQFAAVTFLLSDGTAYISFRGTDNTLVGWKEDFHLSFSTPIPAQLQAVQYLNFVASALTCPLRVGGHSKGGNLAVYASAFCEARYQQRILAIYSNDGPGHDLKTVNAEGYRRISSRIHTYIPKSSIIGMLLEHGDQYRVVDSDAHGLFQHNPYSWQVNDDDFAYLPCTTALSDTLNESIREWLSGMDMEKRRFLFDTIFDVLSASEAKTLRELRSDTRVMAPIINAAMSLPPEERKQLVGLLTQFFRVAATQYGAMARGAITPVRNLADDLREEAKPLMERLSGLRAMAGTLLNKLEELPFGASSGEKKSHSIAEERCGRENLHE